MILFVTKDDTFNRTFKLWHSELFRHMIERAGYFMLYLNILIRKASRTAGTRSRPLRVSYLYFFMDDRDMEAREYHQTMTTSPQPINNDAKAQVQDYFSRTAEGYVASF